MSNVVGQTPLYRRDYYAWALEQARALQERRFEALDFEHLAEEVEDLAKGERRVSSDVLRCRTSSARLALEREGISNHLRSDSHRLAFFAVQSRRSNSAPGFHNERCGGP